jgi:hypothetical protein
MNEWMNLIKMNEFISNFFSFQEELHREHVQVDTEFAVYVRFEITEIF